ncbi:hypothetical protein CLV86_0819 [Lacinutrix venerupis]|uniref:hypothetical protein n=1 Tax=Lacinutrix venerupis TaxID=1486034 RepID=UPI000EB054FD|nr:hypothetical protein [Lacinutrix venerupis]RLJ67322.1 hypothetical protein CLV86_0819 [Lacinutrix venerupis]
MTSITKYIIIAILAIFASNAAAQDSIPKSKEQSIKTLKQNIKNEEKEALKIEVEAINQQVTEKKITYGQAENLKEIAAKKRALNIENRILILENKLAFYERNNLPTPIDENGNLKRKEYDLFFKDLNSVNSFTGVTVVNPEKKKIKYDTRTTFELSYAGGFNNAIVDGGSLNDSPYDIQDSEFWEIGLNWKTRLGVSGNAPRIKYGLTFQTNRYSLEDNKIFVQNGNTTTLEPFSENLKLAELRITNLVIPFYFEFGKMRKIEKTDYVRYVNDGKFKIGVGGFAGLRTGTMQKLKYKQDGDRVKEKIKRNYNTNPIVYGVGAYIGVGDISLYAKYDISKTFKNDALDQNNISLGIRMDFD